MSIENAILAHAAAVDKLAEAIRMIFTPGAVVAAVQELHASETQKTAQTSKADAKKGKVEAGAGKTESAETATTAIAKAELEQAIKDAKAGTGGEEPEPLDYNKDVKPVLLAAVKRAGKEPVQALIKTYGVNKGDEVDPAKFAELVAKAEKLEK